MLKKKIMNKELIRRQKISIANKKRWKNDDYRKKMMGHIPWNKGLTSETSPLLKEQADKKSKWWKDHDTTETRRKIGLASKLRTFPKGDKSSSWKGGSYTTKRDGYVYIWCPNHPNAKKNGKGGGGYVLEHRLVMENIIGRYLTQEEEVHHRNGIKNDNRPENLMFVLHSNHFEECGCPKCGFKIYIK